MSEIMIELVKEEKDFYLSDFLEAEGELSKSEPGWFTDLRKDAIQRFRTLGFPSRKQEAWRYTDIAPIRGTHFRPAPRAPRDLKEAALDGLEFGSIGFPRIVFVDGCFSRQLSRLEDLPEGIRFKNLATALREDDPTLGSHLSRYASYKNEAFVALNLAFTQDGFFLEVPRNLAVQDPIHIIFLSTEGDQAQRVHPRNLVLVGDNAEVTFIESYIGLTDQVYLCNPVTEIVIGNNAFVDHYRLQNESRKAFHVALNQVQQGRDSRYTSCAVDLGAQLTRNELACVLNGEGGTATLNGLYLLNGSQHVDNYTTLEHAQAHCASRELFKGILDDKANGIFRGRIIVHKKAQKTDSIQTNRNLLLSDDCLVNTKPQLEIYADDVKCTHGATIGQLDRTALFYLRSRGIPAAAARSLLIYAFASEVIDRIKVESLRQQLADFLTSWLPGGELVKEAYEG